MLLPAVYSMRLNGTLPSDFALIGFARSPYDDDAFRQYCKEQLDEFMPEGQKPQSPIWDDFAKRIGYITADFNDMLPLVVPKERFRRGTTKTLVRPAITCSISPRRRRSFPRSSSISKRRDSTRTTLAGRASSWRRPFGTDSRLRTEGCRKDRVGISRETRCIASTAIWVRKGAGYHGAAICECDIRTNLEPELFVGLGANHSAETLGVEERGGYYEGGRRTTRHDSESRE